MNSSLSGEGWTSDARDSIGGISPGKSLKLFHRTNGSGIECPRRSIYTEVGAVVSYWYGQSLLYIILNTSHDLPGHSVNQGKSRIRLAICAVNAQLAGGIETPCSGSVNQNVLPLPFPSDSTQIRPPCTSTMRLTKASPPASRYR